ncbi:MAG TPA: hypothetical protein VMC82_01130 [Thermoplasmata archaeon]|nr:hypothetical protein [Thermoplasmata archaeon]
MVEVTSLSEALTAIGHPGLTSSRRPVLRSADATLITLATFDPDGAPIWHGLWIDAGGVRALGPDVGPSLVPGRERLAAPTLRLVDLVHAAYRTYIERLESLGERIDALEGKPDPAPLPELGSLLHALAGARKQIVRLEVLVAELDGPLGEGFPGLPGFLPEFRSTATHVDQVAQGQAQAVRDLVAIRNAVESNQLAAAANRLGEVSNGIAALANTSNVRMLGVAYVALVIALVSVVVLIPNTGATILGMPSAAWVPGVWVDVILVVLAIVPLVLVFTRPWVRQTFRALPSFESRTAEGLSDLPEVGPDATASDRPLRPRGP